jgi:hypothetical protein
VSGLLLKGIRHRVSPQLFLGIVYASLSRHSFDHAAIEQVEKAPLESYADVGGLESQVQEIKEAVELPLTHPELYEDIGIKPPKVHPLDRNSPRCFMLFAQQAICCLGRLGGGGGGCLVM